MRDKYDELVSGLQGHTHLAVFVARESFTKRYGGVWRCLKCGDAAQEPQLDLTDKTIGRGFGWESLECPGKASITTIWGTEGGLEELRKEHGFTESAEG